MWRFLSMSDWSHTLTRSADILLVLTPRNIIFLHHACMFVHDSAEISFIGNYHMHNLVLAITCMEQV